MITATDSAAQKYATVFPEYFVKAMSEASSDLDKNGRTSIFEVFSAASAAVKQHYQQRGQLTTERALFDDNGDGVGREAEAPGPDGALARLLYLDAEAAGRRQQSRNWPRSCAAAASSKAEAEALKLKKGAMPAPTWEAEYEKLMIELAKVSRDIRAKLDTSIHGFRALHGFSRAARSATTRPAAASAETQQRSSDAARRDRREDDRPTGRLQRKEQASEEDCRHLVGVERNGHQKQHPRRGIQRQYPPITPATAAPAAANPTGSGDANR